MRLADVEDDVIPLPIKYIKTPENLNLNGVELFDVC